MGAEPREDAGRTHRASRVREGSLRPWTAVALLLLVALALNGNYLRGGFQADDFFFLNRLQDDAPSYSRWKGFWAFDEMPAISSLWWFEGETAMDVFWRPVPSWIFEALVRLFGDRARPLHLLSVLVHGLVAGTVFLLARRLTGRPRVALLAGIVFLACEDHSLGVGWIAAATDLYCVLFINLALIAHAVWLERRRVWMLAAAQGALALALLSKESAVVAPLALVLMSLLMPRGRDEELAPLGPALRRRLAVLLGDRPSWAPPLALLAVYLALYRLLGFGGISSGLYVDPFTAPGRFLEHLALHLPVMWLATLSPFPPSLAMFLPQTVLPLALAGALAFSGWMAGLWFLRRRAIVAWALALYLLALLPQMSTDASERGLYFPMVGASLLLALLIAQVGPFARRLVAESPSAPLAARAAGWAALCLVLVPGLILSATLPFFYLPSNERIGREATTALPHIEERQPEHVLLLNTSGFIQTFYPAAVIDYYIERPVDIRILSALNGVVTVERVDDRSFILSTDRKGWLTGIFARMLRRPGPPEPGRVYERGFLRATFLEMSADGKDVLAVRFDLERPFDDPGLLILQWDGETFRPLEVAALPAGRQLTLADTSDVWASLW